MYVRPWFDGYHASQVSLVLKIQIPWNATVLVILLNSGEHPLSVLWCGAPLDLMQNDHSTWNRPPDHQRVGRCSWGRELRAELASLISHIHIPTKFCVSYHHRQSQCATIYSRNSPLANVSIRSRSTIAHPAAKLKISRLSRCSRHYLAGADR